MKMYYIKYDSIIHGVMIIGYREENFRNETLAMANKGGYKVYRTWEEEEWDEEYRENV